MLEQDPALAERITAVVKDIETRTSAELVIVIATRSDRYAEVPWMVGAAGGWLALGFLAWSPFVFDGAWFPLDVAMVGGVCGWLARRSRHLAQWLTRPARRSAAVAAAARAAFVEEVVHGTRARTGLLVYVSVLEEEVVVLPDEGLLGRVPAGEWGGVHVGAHGPDELERDLRALGARLERWLPAEAGDNPDEIPDAPRFR